MVYKIANKLGNTGFDESSKAVILGNHSIHYLAVMCGVWHTGGSITPVSPLLSDDAIRSIIADCRPHTVFITSDLQQRLDISGGSDELQQCILLDDDIVDSKESLANWVEGISAEFDDRQYDDSRAFTLLYTSGTTGMPKGVVYSRETRNLEIGLSIESFNFSNDSILLSAIPFYSNTSYIMLLPTLSAGGHIIIQPKFDAAEFLRIAETQQVTHAMLVPVQYERILGCERFSKADLSHFQQKMCTSAPLRMETKKRIVDEWPGGFLELYGMSEGGVVLGLDGVKYPTKLHTVGVPLIGELMIVDDHDRVVVDGEIGEIVGRSASMMESYYNRDDLTREASWYDAVGNRWQRTGDLARKDSDGFVEIMGRKKDMIISGGFNIYPVDLEAVIANHPAVREVAVIGVPSEAWGETPYAFVVANDDADSSAEGILTWANECLGKAQRISGIQWLDDIPRNGLGKPMKNALRDIYDARAQ